MRSSRQPRLLSLVTLALVTGLAARDARADDEPAAPTSTPAADPPPAAAPVAAPTPAAATPLLPPPPPAPSRVTFDVDPVADGAVIGVSLAFATLLDRVNSTGEIKPQQIDAGFRRSQLLGIDRIAVSHTPSSGARKNSNVVLFLASAFAVVDPVLSGLRENSVQTALADGVMYAESFSLTFAMTNMVKIAVRRPRPIAYIEAEKNRNDPTYSNTTTDSALSFFSGHASTVATLGATATYLAFARAPRGSLRPWVTFALATLLTTAVSIERVRSGAHFPTDVIAGTVAGAGIGLVVPHLHRSEDIKQRRLWVGFQQADGFGRERAEGGSLMLGGVW